MFFVYSLDYARTRLANDAKASKKGGERQFNGLVDVYRKTLKSDGIAGLYRGFNISCVGIIVYRGLYFGMYDSLKPVLLTGNLQVSVFICLLCSAFSCLYTSLDVISAVSYQNVVSLYHFVGCINASMFSCWRRLFIACCGRVIRIQYLSLNIVNFC